MLQQQFDPDKLKFKFSSESVITHFSMKVSGLCFVGRAVADIVPSDVPEGSNEKDEWRFNGEKITAIPVDYAGLVK